MAKKKKKSFYLNNTNVTFMSLFLIIPHSDSNVH